MVRPYAIGKCKVRGEGRRERRWQVVWNWCMIVWCFGVPSSFYAIQLMVFAFATKPCSIGLSRTTRTQTTAMRVPWLFSFLYFASNVALQGEQRRHEIGEKSISESFPLGSGRVDATLGCGRHADHPQLGGQGLPVLFPCCVCFYWWWWFLLFC